MYEVGIIGGGIVGLATAHALVALRPDTSVLLLEKEADWGSHQSGRNSGVVHSGLYYAPGSLKATLASAGRRRLAGFCEEHGIAYEPCGKLVVAVDRLELPRLEALAARGRANGLDVRLLSREQALELEPHAAVATALHVPETAVTDFGAVCATLAALLDRAGTTLVRGARVEGVELRPRSHVLHTPRGAFEARVLVNCAGLHSDRVARMAGIDPPARIVPFSGEYYELVPERRSLVASLLYPLPNPAFPFLGVHMTRGVSGSVHVGPNAVPALGREAYRRRDVALRETAQTLAYPGFRKLVRRHGREGLHEVARSLSKTLFVRSAQRLVPEIERSDLVRAPAGIRAQALLPDGGFVDDFLIVEAERAVHVLNAPSPAATAALEIGRSLAALVAQRLPAPILVAPSPPGTDGADPNHRPLVGAGPGRTISTSAAAVPARGDERTRR